MSIDGIIKAIVILIAIGIVAWAADKYLPLEQPIKGIVLFLVCLLGVAVLLSAVGVIQLSTLGVAYLVIPNLPMDPRVSVMPEPFTDAWRAWLPTTTRMNLATMVAAAGCDLRGCRVEHAWDEEHQCMVFFHNGHPINWSTYQSLFPPAGTDHEAFFRVVWELHQGSDKKDGANPLVPKDVPPEPEPVDPEESSRLGAVYAERNLCVSLIARLATAAGFKAYLAEDSTQDEGWRNVVFVELPTGQVSWHVHDREMRHFAGLPRDRNRWDGHDTAEKYRRVVAPWPWESRH